MAESKPAPTAPSACRTPTEQVLALGRKLRVAGTPTIYFADGSRTGSAFDVAALEAKLNAAKSN
jgi:thiol:disulfide interchange protein DsbC